MGNGVVDNEAHVRLENAFDKSSIHPDQHANDAASASASLIVDGDLHSGTIENGGQHTSSSQDMSHVNEATGISNESDFSAATASEKGFPSIEQSSAEPGQDGAEIQKKSKELKEVDTESKKDTEQEEYVSDSESLDSMMDNIRYHSLKSWANETREVQERTKKSTKRLIQQMDYAQLMEDRVKDVERRLRWIENKGMEPEEEAVPAEWVNKYPDLKLSIGRLTLAEYLSAESKVETGRKPVDIEHKPRHQIPGQSPYHLIDVIFTEMDQAERPYPGTKSLAGSTDAKNAAHATPSQLSTSDSQSQLPERIRINSPLLLEALEKITDIQFTRSVIDGERELLSQVILRPFKIFVTYAQEIRDEVERLENLHVSDGEHGRPRSLRAIVGDKHQLSNDALPTESNSQSKYETVTGNEGENAIDVASFTEVDNEVDRLASKRCLEELRVLRLLLDVELQSTFDLRKQIKEGVCRNIAFRDLWHLFPLGEEVVHNSGAGQHQIYRVVGVNGGKSFLCSRLEAGLEEVPILTTAGRDQPKFSMLTYFYLSDGKDLGACEKVLDIKWYDGMKAISSLPCYPITYAKGSSGRKPREYFIERGKRCMELTRNTDVVHKQYNGLSLAMDQLREEIDSEVIIDIGMAILKNSVRIDYGVTHELINDDREFQEDHNLDRLRSTQLLGTKGFMRDFIETDSDLSDEDYLVCPCWVYGYVLRSRKWVNLNVDLVEDIKERGSGFDSLVLPDGHKETLLALVQTHSKGRKLDVGHQTENRQMDLVRGKGKGLIILLHGEPGVGKSSTAESVAEYTRRPLFQVTCGDIGESADEVEIRLENHFQLAHKWGCVMLLDEADVFLTARDKRDLKRNAIVSVFLRVLEYYSGILFLTTNRVGAFDQAFRSRIHMSLFYPRIEEDATVQIWEMNINRARDIWGDKLSIDDGDRRDILDFASKHYRELQRSESTWNGRQIRNAFQTAIALAEWDAHQDQLKYKTTVALVPRLERKHVERVAKASQHFDAYLKETLVASAADLAHENRERKDDFDPNALEA